MTLKKSELLTLTLRERYEQCGYRPFRMSKFEEYDFYVRNKEALTHEGVITFTDIGGKLMALKPDVTLSIIKNIKDPGTGVQKLFYNENVYRISKGNQCYKEIMQVGLECIGAIAEEDLRQVLLLAAKSLQLICPRFVLDLSHMGLISAVLRSSGLSPAGQTAALTCLREKNPHDLASLCDRENVDASVLTALCSCEGTAEEVLSLLKPMLSDPAAQGAWQQLHSLCTMLRAAGFGHQIRVDFSVGNDLKYYSGVVFKGYLEGIPTSVLSGGQYDALLQKMGRRSSAIGFAIYTDLLERLESKKTAYDVDTLLLHEGSADTGALLAAVEALSESGSVLVASTLPENKRWRRLARFSKGEVTVLEDNG